MDRAEQYTVFIKNSIAFPMFGPEYRRNNVIPGDNYIERQKLKKYYC
jgi:hypothetical protein